MKTKLYAKLADLVVAKNNCIKHASETNDTTERERANEWKLKHEYQLTFLVSKYMPSGSGFDAGTRLDLNACNANRLVFKTSYHHVDENGSYGDWTEHTVRVYPTFGGVRMTITGENKNDIKNYIYESFDIVLDTEVV